MTILMQASNQWATRPDDERFTTLTAMRDHFLTIRNNSREIVVPSRKIECRPVGEDHKGLAVVGPQGNAFGPTHWAFGQLATLAGAPPRYLRSLPSEIAADCVNYGMRFARNVDDVGILLHANGQNTVRAATGPKYGRIWNAPILNTLVDRFGDGVSGEWKVPGEFGQSVTVTKANTTLFAGDRDMFVFLADEKNRIEIPNRRNGQSGSLARGFFVWNSEVGSATFGVATFLFDYVCCNRIVWGVSEHKEIRLRHTATAPDKWLDEVQPALIAYSNSSARTIVDGVAKAQAALIGADKVDEFLAARFGKTMVEPLKMTHTVEEGRPIESLWDVSTAVTAYARGIEYQDTRVALERQAGEVLDLAAA